MNMVILNRAAKEVDSHCRSVFGDCLAAKKMRQNCKRKWTIMVICAKMNPYDKS